MRVYLVRHGETDWNAARRVQGHSDIPLNANGISQAKQAAKYLAAIKFDKVYSSDLGRAVETAKILSGGVHPIEKPGFREKFFGEAEGAVTTEWRDRYKTDPFSYGETQAELVERMEATYWQVVEESAGAEHVLIAAHGACLKALLRRLVSSGKVDGGKHAEEAVSGTTPFVNCAMTLVQDNKLLEYGLAITEASIKNAI